MKPKFLLLTGATLLAAHGCATAANKALDAKVAQVPAAKTERDLDQEARRAIENDQDLSAQQRSQLRALRERLVQERKENLRESLRLRAVLMDDTLSPVDRQDEVGLVKKKLKALEERRIDQTFAAVKEANSILAERSASHAEAVQKYLHAE